MRVRFPLFAILVFSVSAFAHVGSPDVYYEGNAGPYHLLVTIRPPAAVARTAAAPVRKERRSGVG